MILKMNNQGKISVGHTVKLKSKRTNSVYIVTEFFKNFLDEKWAVCKNIETNEISHHPISDLIIKINE